jgi:hypothetical protein
MEKKIKKKKKREEEIQRHNALLLIGEKPRLKCFVEPHLTLSGTHDRTCMWSRILSS